MVLPLGCVDVAEPPTAVLSFKHLNHDVGENAPNKSLSLSAIVLANHTIVVKVGSSGTLGIPNLMAVLDFTASA